MTPPPDALIDPIGTVVDLVTTIPGKLSREDGLAALRLPQEGPCECDIYLTCPKFLTTTKYAPRLRERLCLEETTH
jgi:hypothetical protein